MKGVGSTRPESRDDGGDASEDSSIFRLIVFNAGVAPGNDVVLAGFDNAVSEDAFVI